MYQQEIDDLKKNIEEMQANLKKLEEKAASPGRWRAEKGCGYWFVYDTNLVVASVDNRTSSDNNRLESGNYYRTEEEAERFKKLRLAVKRQMMVPLFISQKYWTIRTAVKEVDWDFWNDSPSDKLRYALGIVFPTEHAAQEYLDSGLADVLLKEAWGE